MFPKTEDSPAGGSQTAIYKTVSFHIGFDFIQPKLTIAFYFLALLSPLVSMPKMTVAEDRNPLRHKCKVRSAQNWWVFLWFEICRFKCLPQDSFNLRSGAPDSGHIETDLSFSSWTSTFLFRQTLHFLWWEFPESDFTRRDLKSVCVQFFSLRTLSPKTRPHSSA